MKFIRWVPLLTWVFIVFWLSFSPLDKITIKPPIGADKVAHIIMYAFLGWLTIWTSPVKRIQSMLILLAFLIAAGTELVQHYLILNRSGDVLDFAANCIGLIVVILTLKQLKKLNT